MGMDFYVETKNRNGGELIELFYAGNGLFAKDHSIINEVGNGKEGKIFDYGVDQKFRRLVKPFKKYYGRKALSVLNKVKSCINPEIYDDIVDALMVNGSYLWCWW